MKKASRNKPLKRLIFRSFFHPDCYCRLWIHTKSCCYARGLKEYSYHRRLGITPDPEGNIFFLIKKAQVNFTWGSFCVYERSLKNSVFLRNVYPSSIQTMTVGFGFAPNPAVTLAGLKSISYHRRLGITPDPEGIYLPLPYIITLHL